MNTQTLSEPRKIQRKNSIPPLENGDRLTQRDFHRLYEAMPENVKAELIEGIVFMSSPVRAKNHGEPSAKIITWIGYYSAFTSGTDIAENVTLFLDSGNEYQPDAVLRIKENCGGKSSINEDDYLKGSPELIIEVSASTISKDLFEKKSVYQRNGISEYLVWRVYDNEIDWFRLQEETYQKIESDELGIIESNIFPGLRLNVKALLKDDLRTVLADLQKGFKSKKYRDFVNHLSK